MELKDKLLELKKDEIVKAAGELFFTKGYTQTSMDEIATRLAVGKPFIYSCFSSKSALLAEVCNRTTALVAGMAHDAVNELDTPSVRLEHIVRQLCLRAIEGRFQLAVLFREVKNLPDEAVEQLANNFHLFNQLLNKLLEQGVACGEFDVVDPGVVTHAISGMTTWIYAWFKPDGPLSADEVSNRMVELAMRMVARR